MTLACPVCHLEFMEYEGDGEPPSLPKLRENLSGHMVERRVFYRRSADEKEHELVCPGAANMTVVANE